MHLADAMESPPAIPLRSPRRDTAAAVAAVRSPASTSAPARAPRSVPASSSAPSQRPPLRIPSTTTAKTLSTNLSSAKESNDAQSPQSPHGARASPEIISSLITTLSAIKAPAERHLETSFDYPGSGSSSAHLSPHDRFPHHRTESSMYAPSGLHTPPTSPPSRGSSTAWRRSLISDTSFGMDYGAFRAPSTECFDPLRPDEAAIAPVIRMVKPPAPVAKKQHRLHKKPLSRAQTPPSRMHEESTSYADQGSDQEDVVYIGSDGQPLEKLELQTLPRKGSRSSVTSSLSGRSLKSLRLLKRAPTGSDGRTSRASAVSQTSDHRHSRGFKSVRSMPSLTEANGDGDDQQPTWPDKASSFRSADISPIESGRKDNWELDKAIWSPKVPQRKTSLRHSSTNGSLGTTRRSSTRGSAYSQTLQFPIESEDSADEVEYRDNSTSRRITELKKQQRKALESFAGVSDQVDSPVLDRFASRDTRHTQSVGLPEDTLEEVTESDCDSPANEKAQTTCIHEDPVAESELSLSSPTQTVSTDKAVDRIELLAQTLSTGVRETEKSWFSLKDENASPLPPQEDDEDCAPAPAISTRATKNSPPSRSASKKRISLIRSKSYASNGTKSTLEKRMSAASMDDGFRSPTSMHPSQTSIKPTMSNSNSNIQPPSSPGKSGVNSPQDTNSLQTTWSYNNMTTGDEPTQENQQTKQSPQRPSSSDSIDDAVDEYLADQRLNQTVLHPAEDRNIAFSEVGDPKGYAVFVCLGMGLTRYVTAFYDELARALKLRLITPDRPGVGGSEACEEGRGAPLTWPDDIAIICNHLKITKFSLLAHSAGAIYALATALRLPQHIRGRVHLLAPWIPPSQIEMSNITNTMGLSDDPTSPGAKGSKSRALAMPYSQRILKALPTPIFKVANAGFMTVTSASLSANTTRTSTPRRNRWRSSSRHKNARNARGNRGIAQEGSGGNRDSESRSPGTPKTPNGNAAAMDSMVAAAQPENAYEAAADSVAAETPVLSKEEAEAQSKERQMDFDARLTNAIWDLATTNANPSVDLLVCLERQQPIGFRYADITSSVVIHHGERDNRVPLENVRWIGKTMRRCEVRVLEDEGHGLMASGAVMGNVLMEIAGERDAWKKVSMRERSGSATSSTAARQAVRAGV